MPRQLVYIASLSHSGSTLLDLVLGGHPDLTGLGEIALTISREPAMVARTAQAVCSCGCGITSCPFWSGAERRLEAVTDDDLTGRYEAVLNEFDARFGRSGIAVDSSKYLPVLRTLAEHLRAEIKVIHLIKDVRNYTISQLDRGSGAGKSAYRHFRAWYRGNRKLAAFLKKSRLPFMRVGYEDLCLRPELVLPRICEFIGVAMDDRMLDIGGSGSHVMRGNRMRAQAGKRRSVQYDYRWFRRCEWQLPALLSPRIMRFNAKAAYRDDIAGLMSNG